MPDRSDADVIFITSPLNERLWNILADVECRLFSYHEKLGGAKTFIRSLTFTTGIVSFLKKAVLNTQSTIAT